MDETEYKTEFAEFAQTLAVKYQGDRKPEEFAKELFQEMYLPDKEDDPVDRTLSRTYKAYFYGNRDITVLARDISTSLDPGGFAKYIESDNDSTIKFLCDSFRKYSSDIDAKNYGLRIADRFDQIITKAAAKKTRRRKKTDVAVPEEPDLKARYGAFLVAEAGSICQGDGCTKPLFINENGHKELLYDIAVIDPKEDPEDPDNLIAMCPECCAKYKVMRNKESIERVRERKKKLLENYEDQTLVADAHVQEGVRKVIEMIPSMRVDPNVDLNYSPVTLMEKIEPNNVLLFVKARGHVNVYVNDVKEAFQNMSREGKLRYEPFCRLVRMTYENLRDKGYDQNRIYSELTKWLCNETKEEWGACEVVISYFIQECEVFDVISK